MSIRELIEQRTDKQRELNDIVTEYIIRYIQKIYKSLDEKRTIHFQKVLLYISEWDNERLSKFYDKFNRFVSKKNDKKYDLQKNLESVIALNIKIMLSLSNEKKMETNIPSGSVFLYKCLRSTAKAYYNSPKYIREDTDVQKTLVSEIVELCLQKCIPTRELLDYYSGNTEYVYNEETEETEEQESESEKFQKEESEELTPKLIVDKQTHETTQTQKTPEQELKYLLKDEYYESDDNNDNIHNEKNDVKQIMLAKKSKRI